MSAQRVSSDDVEKLQGGLVLRDATPAQLRDRAERLYAWATQTDVYELSPGVERSYLLAAAAEDFLASGDGDRALGVAREAKASARLDDFSPYATLVTVHIGRGDVQAAKSEAEEARKGAAADPAVAELIGDAFELGDQLEIAERWYTIGVRGLDRHEGRFWYERLLRDRHRVRRDQGKAPDVMDLDFESLAGE